MEGKKGKPKEKVSDERDKLPDEVSINDKKASLVSPESIVLVKGDVEALLLLFGAMDDKLDVIITILKSIRDGRQNQEPR